MEKYDEFSILKINSYNSIQSNINIIKELIDNSLDAKSTIINLELHDSATTKIICLDNGIGISQDFFESIGKRGATTKISQIEDTFNLKTHGFRGQAISAIANLCNLTIFTKTKNEENLQKIKFSENGIISNWEKIPKNYFLFDFKEFSNFESGTIFIVDEIFNNNSIRKEAIMKKKEFYLNEIYSLIQNYALINTNVNFEVFQKQLNFTRKIFNFPIVEKGK
jgi:DNA mismatch repair protein MutL